MHREITHADRAFGQEPGRLSLYLLTALIGLIIAADLWPAVAAWLGTFGLTPPTWSNEVAGYRVALVAAVLGGARVLYGSLDSLLQGRIGADLALAVACVAAILIKEPLVAAEVVFVGLIGECLESVTFERTRRAVRRLAELTPRRCWRLREGQEERVLVSELQVGDRVVVKPGAKVPADGVILDGRSAVDVSPLTGESLPVDKGPGDEVLAGSLNQHGALTVEARRVAEQTVVGRVVELTARALADKAPLERTADRLARLFLPAVLAVALLTFVAATLLFQGGWFRPADAPRPDLATAVRFAVYPTLSVLVVACPCALILATPAAVIAALGRLAGTGVLIKGGSALERLAGVDAFLFDKTGTLTEGRLELGDVVPLGETSADELLRLAATAEQLSEHPIARLVVQEAAARGLRPDGVAEFQAHPGSGVSAKAPAGELLVGNRRLLEERGVPLSAAALAALDRLDAAGQTVLLVAVSGRVVGVVGARDRVRPSAALVLAELRLLGVARIAMLTGDRPAVARAVADQLGLAEYHAELLPQDKAEFVARCEGRAAMVGDGVNDAPALARAAVGLAIGGSGADVAAEAGDVVLMLGPTGARDPLAHLPLLLRLSRETVRIIRQNILVFAFGVNVAGVVLTAWLWPLLVPARWFEHGPLAAVLYHQLGSLLVLLNSMRLLWFERGAGAPGYRWSGRLRAANEWMEKRLDLDEALHALGHRWRPVAAAVAALVLLGWVGSGLCAVNEGEVGIVQQFGRPLPGDLTPGLHWRWPWPIETVRRVGVDRVHTLEIGFRTPPGGRAVPGARSWSSAHEGGAARDADEAVMITGDGNLLEVQGSVRYRVSDPRVYLFGVAQPEAVLRHATESVLREVVAGRRMADLLTADRGAFQREVFARLARRCDELGGLGVRLEGVSLHDLHPPQEVVQAYHDVTRAMELRDKYVQQAEQEAIEARSRQESAGRAVEREAEAQAYEKVRLAGARRDEFAARLAARLRPGWKDEGRLLLEVMAALQAGRPRDEVAREYRQRRQGLIDRQVELTDFRVYWDVMTAALAGRPKVLIDSDRLPVRRQLWLVPFEPPPMLPPRRPAATTAGEP